METLGIPYDPCKGWRREFRPWAWIKDVLWDAREWLRRLGNKTMEKLARPCAWVYISLRWAFMVSAEFAVLGMPLVALEAGMIGVIASSWTVFFAVLIALGLVSLFFWLVARFQFDCQYNNFKRSFLGLPLKEIFTSGFWTQG